MFRKLIDLVDGPVDQLSSHEDAATKSEYCTNVKLFSDVNM
jgi:hypothetical protein